MLKLPVIALGFAVVLLAVAVAAAGLPPAPAAAQGDGILQPPGNVRAADGETAGAVVVAWDAPDGAAFYRIGWVALDDVAAALADGREWLDAFAFTDVTNRGQTDYRIAGLAAGREYAIIVGSIAQRFGAAAWLEWAYLTLAAAAAVSCPTDGGAQPSPTPGATATPAPATPLPPTPAPTPTPAGSRNNYDTDGDGLIEVSSLEQLAAIRSDLNGDGASPARAYAAAFPYAMPGMGCPDSGCTGYELVADLDFDTNGNGDVDDGDDYWNDGAGWVPIGDRGHKFTADFDGNNHTIANLYINRSDTSYVGLFGYARGSIIKQVELVSVNVTGGDYVGGLLGEGDDVKIQDNYITGNVVSVRIAGGLAGGIENSIISESNVIGNITGGSEFVGGLFGYSIGVTINRSYVVGNVSGGKAVGGLVGRGGGTIIASYATGSVAGGGDDIGGLVGKNTGGAITASYAVGPVSTSGDTFYIGGLIGYDEDGDIAASYWDTETTGQSSSYGGVGKTTAELQSPMGYTGIYADWNLDLDGDGGGDEPWDFGNAGQYPVLRYGGLDVGAQRR